MNTGMRRNEQLLVDPDHLRPRCHWSGRVPNPIQWYWTAAEDAVLLTDGTRLVLKGIDGGLRQRLPHLHRAPKHHLQRVLARRGLRLQETQNACILFVLRDRRPFTCSSACIQALNSGPTRLLPEARARSDDSANRCRCLDLTLIHTVKGSLIRPWPSRSVCTHRHLRVAIPQRNLERSSLNELDFARVGPVEQPDTTSRIAAIQTIRLPEFDSMPAM